MQGNFRPPAVPLVTVDPYFSIWMFDEQLTADYPRHWTGQRNALTGLLQVDGTWKRFLGKTELEATRWYREPDAMEQVSLEVRPTATICRFRCKEVTLDVTFRTPLLLDDLMLLSRPVSYVSYEITSNDGAEHAVTVYFEASAEAAVDRPNQTVTFGKSDYSIFCGRGEADMLTKSGDDMRIDWGWLHLYGQGYQQHFFDRAARRNYLKGKTAQELSEGDKVCVADCWPSLCLTKEMAVAANGAAADFLCIGYDDINSLEYFGEKIAGYWKKDGAAFADVARQAMAEHSEIMARCDAFDMSLIARAECISRQYADIVSLAYRQAIAAHKLAWDGKKLVFLSKECYSNGCIGTVDVTYPSIPLFLLYNPELVCGMLDPVFEYAASKQWEYGFAPHDIGQYPLANGQVYGYRPKTREMVYHEQMPIEECGNMLLCAAAVCWKQGTPDYAIKHEALLQQWTDYLVENGFDPENQLCTDDFAGHLAHNCNLSVKAIMGIAAWGMLLGMMQRTKEAETYLNIARDLAKHWKEAAFDGDHYRLAFDQPGSWSIKYNLVWDKLFGLQIFDEDIFETETAYYAKHLNQYGVPLDSRKEYTKSDWEMWSTVLSGGAYADNLISAMWHMLCDTQDRVPFTDWYETKTADMSMFQNRTVQGGLFINLLAQ